MSLLLDTNILLRAVQPVSPHHADVVATVERLYQADIDLCVVPQVIYEFWVAATRPVAVNGLGMDVPAATHSVEEALRDYRLLKDERGIFGHWQYLVTANNVQGKQAHDARLVAAMQRHGVANLLTFNKPDFARFAGIAVFSPSEILAGQLPV